MPKPLSLSLDLPFEEAIAAARARNVILPGDYYGKIQVAMRRAAITVSSLTGIDQIQAVVDSLVKAITRGTSFGEWQRIAEAQDWNLPPGRLETVFRTNVQTAYSAGHWRSFEEHKARRGYLMWSAINDSRVRPTHLAMDGYIAPVDDPMWRRWHAPAGYNCRCAQISLTEAQAIARGYGRQALPLVEPDKGFGGGPPGNLAGALGKAVERRVATVEPAFRKALDIPAAPQPRNSPAQAESLHT